MFHRIGIGALALALLVGCGSDDPDDAPERASNRDSYVLSPERRAQVEREQAAKTAGGTPGDRGALLSAVERSILRDARARVRTKELKGPIRRVTCEPTRKSPNAFACTAVTNELTAADENDDNAEVTGVTGHPYRAVVDVATGRYAWCKRILVPGEGGVIDPRAIVPLPKECQA